MTFVFEFFKGIVCADNLAIPTRDKYESQPAIELLRQWIDHKYWADLDDSSKLELVDLVLRNLDFVFSFKF